MLVGNVDLSNRLILAPMAEVTDASFRNIAKKFGAGLTFTQMVSAKGVSENEFGTLRLLAFNKEEKPIGIQILGNDPRVIYAAVKDMVKFKPDIIDLNCGCPQTNVTKHRMGSCLMESPHLIGNIVGQMYKAAEGIPVSAKFRLGYNRNKISILENAKAAQDNGAAMITVHARMRTDKYDQEPDWEWLAKVKQSVSIPVVGNGSIFSALDAVKMKEETGVDSVMVARGSLGNPFIFSRFNSIVDKNFDPGIPAVTQVRDIAIEHNNLLISEYGEIRSLNFIKKNTIWYYKNYMGITYLIDNIIKLNSPESVKELIINHTEKIINEKYPEENLELVKEKFKMKVLFWLLSEPTFSKSFG